MSVVTRHGRIRGKDQLIESLKSNRLVGTSMRINAIWVVMGGNELDAQRIQHATHRSLPRCEKQLMMSNMSINDAEHFLQKILHHAYFYE